MMQEELHLSHNERPQDAVIKLVPEQEQQLALISHMASFSNMLVAVTGLAGSGKSTLAFELLRRHSDLELTLLINADIMFGIPSLLRRIGDIDQQSLPDNRSQAIELLKQQAQLRAEQGKKLLVVIDQAEQIDANTLNEIAHLALLIPNGLAFILFGLTGYEQSIRTGPAQAAVHTQALPPLSEEGVRQLLQQVFSPNQPLALTETELVYLHRQSAGLPGALLLLAGEYFGKQKKQNAFVSTHKRKLTAINKQFPLAHLAALFFLAIALLVSYLYQPANNTEGISAKENTVAEPVDVLRGLPLPVPAESVYPQEQSKTINEAVETYSLPLVSETINNAVGPDYNYAVVNEPEPEIIVQAAEPKIKPIEQPKPAPKVTLTDKEKLLAIKQGAVIQLFGSFEADNARKFKQQWQGQVGKTFYQYQTTNDGKPWHVVVVGVYKSKTEATQAMQQWPTKLRAEKPWVRDIKDIKPALGK